MSTTRTSTTSVLPSPQPSLEKESSLDQRLHQWEHYLKQSASALTLAALKTQEYRRPKGLPSFLTLMKLRTSSYRINHQGQVVLHDVSTPSFPTLPAAGTTM